VKEIILKVLTDIGIYIEYEDIDNVDIRNYITDSIEFVSFIIAIETELGIELPDQVLLYENISSLTGFISLLETFREDLLL